MANTKTVLSIGATGSIGVHIVRQLVEKGYRTRAIVRDLERASKVLPAEVELFHGSPSDPEILAKATDGVDAIVFTHGTHGEPGQAREVEYGFVKAALDAVQNRPEVFISLMTALGVTVHEGEFNRRSEGHDYKRRAERLVRMSGHPHVIVRPGWFDYNEDDERKLQFLQGDKRRSGTPEDGVVAREDIARVLIDAIDIPEAASTTLELVAVKGESQSDLAPLFAALEHDVPGQPDAPLDPDTLPMSSEPQWVLDDLKAA